MAAKYPGYIELSSEYVICIDDDPLCKASGVYCGEQRSKLTGPRKVAIKLTELKKNNIREAEHLIKLSDHPNVLAYIHSGIYTGNPLLDQMYLVTELCQRENLEMLMEENKKSGIHFTESQKKAIAAQFLGGMEYIHSHRIIHRDIKPSNVLVSANGTLIKISDYGLSKSLQDGRSVTNQSISRVGTNGFRAPETYLDNEISQKSDVFSSGLLLYYDVSNGEHAFGKDPDRWNSNIKNGKNLSLTRIYVIEKKQMQKVLKKMLQSDPKKRPTIKEVMEHDVFQHLQTDLQIGGIVTPAANAIVVFDYITEYLQSYKPSTNEWTNMQPKCNDVGLFTPVVLGENIYILSYKKMYRLKYSDPTSKWIELQGTSEDHGWWPRVVAINGFLYIIGGGCQSVERFNVKDRSFEEVEQTPRILTALTGSVEFEGTLYVADKYGILCYNIENKSWKTMELVQWPVNLLRVNIHVVDDELYVVFVYYMHRGNEIHKLNHKTGCLTRVTTTKYFDVDTVALRL